MTTSSADFERLHETVTFGAHEVTTKAILAAVVHANSYLVTLDDKLQPHGIELYKAMDIRNASGFVGAVFAKFCERHLGPGWRINPHPDGRPDILNVSSQEALSYLEQDCHTTRRGKQFALKTPLAPFKYGGVEVKCTIGTVDDAADYPVGTPRGLAITGLTFYGHHRDCTDLLGLYCDYHASTKGRPQILAVFSAVFVADDWREVSVGTAAGKKTSNTSLLKGGIQKILERCLVVTTEEAYRRSLARVGVVGIADEEPVEDDAGDGVVDDADV